MTESLSRVLERTGNKASLVEEYLNGRAPANQTLNQHERQERPSYHELPAVKGPNWKWHVPVYFFTGGIASGAYIVAALADMLGRAEHLALIRAGNLVSLIAAGISPILLILDLGRPQRWYNMLRALRPRSMMNQGSYVLVGMGLFGAAGVMTQLLHALGPKSALYRLLLMPLRVMLWLGIVPATYLGFYTGLLLTATNIPLWMRNRWLMGPLFVSSALSTGLAASHLVAPLLGKVSQETEKATKKAEQRLLIAELGLALGSILAMGRTARPLLSGKGGMAYLGGSIGLGMLVPLALQQVSKTGSTLSKLAPALTLLGASQCVLPWLRPENVRQPIRMPT
jgi:formate-dependent nitrite reductase membrane component NrfD